MPAIAGRWLVHAVTMLAALGVVISSAIGPAAAREIFLDSEEGREQALASRDTLPTGLAEVVEQGISRDSAGRVRTAFGLEAEAAREVLYPVTKTRALPPNYVPADLRYPWEFGVEGAQRVRRLIGKDLADMNAASGRGLAVISGYRPAWLQAQLFERYVAMERAAGLGRAETEQRASGYSARPGNSEHQLGTAIDFNLIDESFADTATGKWLAQHSWEYGFVMSYPLGTEARTGYAYEPWHLRWVGRPLARLLWERGYLDGGPVLDEYLEAIWPSLE